MILKEYIKNLFENLLLEVNLGTIEFDINDIFSCLKKTSSRHKVSNMNVFVAYEQIDTIPSNSQVNSKIINQVDADKNADSLDKIDPQDILKLLKRDCKLPNQNARNTIIGKLSDSDRESAVQKMATEIANNIIYKTGHVIITPVASTNDFSKKLATAVYNKFKEINPEVVYAEDIIVKPTIDDPDIEKYYTHRPEYFEKHYGHKSTVEKEKLLSILKDQDAQNERGYLLHNPPKYPTSSKFKQSLRKYYKLLKVVDKDLKGKSIVIVDDNVREGLTFEQLKEDFTQYGANVTFAVGYRIAKEDFENKMDRKKKKEEEALQAKKEAEKEKKNHSGMNLDNNFVAGDRITHTKFGFGTVVNYNRDTDKVTIKFDNDKSVKSFPRPEQNANIRFYFKI